MKFLSPLRLVLIFGPLALAAAYVVGQRAKRRYAVRFTSVDLLASVAPRRAGWQRHVAPVLLLTAMAALVVGFARPAASVRVPRDRGSVLLVLDTSISMGATDVSPSRLDAAQTAAADFVTKLPSALDVGVVGFDGTVRLLSSPSIDRQAALAAIDQITLGPGTGTGNAIFLALDTIASRPTLPDGSAEPAVIVLMSDGTPTVGRGDQTPEATVDAAVAAAEQANIPVDTIAFGTADGVITLEGQTQPVPADQSAMDEIAAGSDGNTFTATDEAQLETVYAQIGKAVGYDFETRELTTWFTGFGLLIAMVAAALVWTQRLV